MSESSQPPPPSGMTAAVNNFLIPNIIATVFCCFPLGVLGIVLSIQVNRTLGAGDYAGAQDFSSKARICFLGSLLMGALIWFGIIAYHLVCIVLTYIPRF